MANGDSSPDYDTAQPVPLAGLVTGMTPPQPIPRPPPPRPPQPDAGPEPQGPQDWDKQLGQRYGTAPMGIAAPWNRPGPMPRQAPPQQFPDSVGDLIRQFAPTPFRSPFERAFPRPPGQWGQRSWALQGIENYPGTQLPPGLPSIREALGLITGAGQSLGQWGPSSVAQPAAQAAGLARMLQSNPMITMALDIASRGAYSRNMLAAQQGRIRLAQEQMQLKADQAVSEANDLLQQYSKIYDTWALGGYGKPGTPEADEAAEAAVEQLAVRDPNIHAILKNGGMNAVQEYLTHMDNMVQNMAAGAATSRKTSKDGGENPYFEGGGAAGIPHAEEGRFQKPDVTTGQPAPAAPGKPDPSMQAVESGTYDDYLKNKYKDPQGRPMSNAALAAARNSLTDAQAIDKSVPGHGAVHAAAADIRDTMNKVASQPIDAEKLADLPLEKRRDVRMADQEEKLQKLEKLAPDIASVTRSVLNYETPLTGLKTEVQGVVRALAHEISPRTPDGGGFNEAKYDAVKEFYKPGSNVNKVATRSTELLQGVRNSIRAVNLTLDKLGGRDVQRIPQRVIDKWMAGKWSGEPEYDNLYGAMQGMMNQFAGVISLTGTPRVSTVTNLLKEAGPTKSPRQLMMQFANDVANAWKVADGYQSQWMQLTGRNTLMPGMKKSDWEAYMTLSRMNWETGEMPSDAPPEWRAVGRDPAKASAGIPPERRGRPLTIPQLRELKDHIARLRANKNDPSQQRQADDMSKFLPNFLDAATEVPDLD